MEEEKEIKYCNILEELVWDIKNSKNLDTSIEDRIEAINKEIKIKKESLLKISSNLIKEYYEKNMEIFIQLKELGFQIIEIPESGQLIIRYKGLRIDDIAIFYFYGDSIKVQYFIHEYKSEIYPKEVNLGVILQKAFNDYEESEQEYIEHSEFSKTVKEKLKSIEGAYCSSRIQ